jgi:hypothetical protein
VLIELSFDVPGSIGISRLLRRDFNIGKLQDDLQASMSILLRKASQLWPRLECLWFRLIDSHEVEFQCSILSH